MPFLNIFFALFGLVYYPVQAKKQMRQQAKVDKPIWMLSPLHSVGMIEALHEVI